MTSIEFLRKRLPSLFEHDENNFYTNLFNEADEMHKEEVKDGYKQGIKDNEESFHYPEILDPNVMAEYYYNENFKK
jgi:hypothetical protein